MLVSYQEIPDDAKAWIYQSDRALTVEELGEINTLLEGFVSQWTAHTKPVKGFGSVYYKRFIVLLADENYNDVSGCSIDSSVKFIKELENAFGLNFFDRLKVAYKINEQTVGAFPLNMVNEWLENGKITENTIVFNNMITTKKAFETQWEVPLKDSWVSKVMA